MGRVRTGASLRWAKPVWAVIAGLMVSAGLLALFTSAAGAGVPPSGRGFSSQSSGPGLRVIPFPGTPDASSGSQIIFSRLTTSELKWVSVWGSKSGSHSGHLEVLAGGGGTAFVPDHPFTPGELVRVSAGLSSPAAGTAAGDPGATRIGFSFQIAIPASGAYASSARARSSSGVPTRSFHSQPNLHPPVVTTTSLGDAGAGDIFLTTDNMPQPGAVILNSEGQLLAYLPTHKGYPDFNFRPWTYQGQPVLGYWQGVVTHGHGIDGQDVILNDHYQVIKTLHAGNGYSSDLHEFQITPKGNALIDAYVPVTHNLTNVGGSSKGTVLDGVIQELNIKTGRVFWEWHMLGHIPISATHLGKPGSNPYDPYHLNSVQQLSNGNILISARNTWGVYEINKSTGKVIWELGGKHPSFHMGQYTNFEWQHDARIFGNVVSVFDDAALPQEEQHSVAKEISINTKTMTATMIHSIGHSPPLLAGSLGNVQRLPDHNLFVGWGSADSFSEYTLNKKQILNGSLPLGVNSYRAFRFPWTGTPSTSPSIAVAQGSNGSALVYASWNGATKVAFWRVMGGPAPNALSQLQQVNRHSFETTIKVSNPPAYMAVEALDSGGNVIGTSQTEGAPSGGASNSG